MFEPFLSTLRLATNWGERCGAIKRLVYTSETTSASALWFPRSTTIVVYSRVRPLSLPDHFRCSGWKYCCNITFYAPPAAGSRPRAHPTVVTTWRSFDDRSYLAPFLPPTTTVPLAGVRITAVRAIRFILFEVGKLRPTIWLLCLWRVLFRNWFKTCFAEKVVLCRCPPCGMAVRCLWVHIRFSSPCQGNLALYIVVCQW